VSLVYLGLNILMLSHGGLSHMKHESSLDQLFLSMHQTALDYPGGASAAAAKMHVRAGTLLTKLNPLDELHLPNIVEFIRLLDVTENYEALEILCGMFGGRFTSQNDEVCASVTEALLRVTIDAGDVVKVAHECLADGEIDEQEKLIIKRSIAKTRAKLTELENTIKNA